MSVFEFHDIRVCVPVPLLGSGQTLAGALVAEGRPDRPQRAWIRAAHELLVCSDPDFCVLLGGAIQLQQHRALQRKPAVNQRCQNTLLTSSPPPLQ